eukprot:scaffold208992_cov19-Tisochrysis_lutea.AAC.1
MPCTGYTALHCMHVALQPSCAWALLCSAYGPAELKLVAKHEAGAAAPCTRCPCLIAEQTGVPIHQRACTLSSVRGDEHAGQRVCAQG